MAKALCTDAEFVALFERLGAKKMAQELGTAERVVLRRRLAVEARIGRKLLQPSQQDERRLGDYPMRAHAEVADGVVIVASDAHYWPDEITTAHRGLCKLIKELKPKMVVMNGDVLDGARISRHPAIGWTKTPTLKQELAACEERLGEIEKAAGQSCALWWTLGNHCIRFESKLSNDAGEYEGVKGVRLADHFPRWRHAVSLWLNDSVVIKHRIKGGVHATHNNTLHAGKTTVTGHLHSLKVTPFSDYNGTRWGVDTGTASEPYGEHANYAEDNPLNHRSGFIVLTFVGGDLLWPEIVSVYDERRIQFRGALIEV